MAQTMSFDEAMGKPVAGDAPPPGRQEFNFEDVAEAPPEGQGEYESVSAPLKDFASHTAGTVVESWKQQVAHPVKTAVGGAKALAKGIVDIGDLGSQGIRGIISWAGGNTFQKGQEDQAAKNQKTRDVTAAITGINLAPADQTDAAIGNLLALLPEGIVAGGDTVYAASQKSSNPYVRAAGAFVAAGTQGILTFLTLKPMIATKMISPKGNGKPSATVGAAFDELAAKNGEQAKAVADHVAEVDPMLAKYMKSRIDKFVNASEKELADMAEANMKARLEELKPPTMASLKKGLKTPEQAAAEAAKADKSSPTTNARGEKLLTFEEAQEPLYAGKSGLVSKDIDAAGRKLLPYDPKTFVDKEGQASSRLEPRATLEQTGQGIRETYSQAYKDLQSKEPAPAGVAEIEDPIVFDVGGQKVSLRELGMAFKQSGDFNPPDPFRMAEQKAISERATLVETRRQKGKFKFDPKQKGSIDPAIFGDLADKVVDFVKDRKPAELLAAIVQAKDKIPEQLARIAAENPDQPFDLMKWMMSKGGKTIDLEQHKAGMKALEEWVQRKVKKERGSTQQSSPFKVTTGAFSSDIGGHGVFVSDSKGTTAAAFHATTAEDAAKVAEIAEQLKDQIVSHRGTVTEEVFADMAKKAGYKLPVSGVPKANFDIRMSTKGNPGLDYLETLGKNQFTASTAEIRKYNKINKEAKRPFVYEGRGGYSWMHGPFETMEEAQKFLKIRSAEKPKLVIPLNQRGSVDPSVLSDAVKISLGAARKLHPVALMEAKLESWMDQAIRTFNPEALGPEAKMAASITAKAMAEEAQKTSSMTHSAQIRRNFWLTRQAEAPAFLDKFEKGEKFLDPVMQQAADAYTKWNEAIYRKDIANGFEYEAVDHYMYHVFKNPKALAQEFNQLYGGRWTDPKFIKDRKIDLYSQAKKLGYEPKFTNPEDIMLARQHASDMAEMQIQVLNDLNKYGLAKKVAKGQDTPPKDIDPATGKATIPFPAVQWRSPTGQRFWVHTNANAVLFNAFKSTSLWSMENIGGDAFRGLIGLKNNLIPVKLAFSLFHPLHVAGIDGAAAMTRASQELLSGNKNPISWAVEIAQAMLLYKSLWANPRTGSRIMQIWKGKIKPGDMTSADKFAMQSMFEGGFIPEMSTQYRSTALKNFQDAVRKREATAVFKLPLAVIGALGKPFFEHWIPNLKIASYLADVKTALKVDPSLANDAMKRGLAFRRIAKSVDNRYGEMAYSTLFWNKIAKDIGVANTLSLGWNLGFLREYGGGTMDLGQFALGKGTVAEKVKSGLLNRPLFVTLYTTQALLYGGLMTYALTGKTPEDLMDYVYPKTGEKNPDGTDARVNTMYYTREFGSIYKHSQNEGIYEGIKHTILNKGSGMIGLVGQTWSGVNAMGQEIRDPDAPAYKQLEQTILHSLTDIAPITFDQLLKGEGSSFSRALSFSGFGPVPKYVEATPTEGMIKTTFSKYFGSKQTPFEKAQYSTDAKKAKDLYAAGKDVEYEDAVEEMRSKFDLTPHEFQNLKKGIRKGEDPIIKMFQRLPWQKQKKILDQATPEEREVLVRKSNKQHLRQRYEEPVK